MVGTSLPQEVRSSLISRLDSILKPLAWEQPLDPFGSNIVTYLLERFTSRDPKWSLAEEWLRRIDPKLSILKSPLRGAQGSVETQQTSGFDVNVAYQGTGIQKTLTVIAGSVF